MLDWLSGLDRAATKLQGVRLEAERCPPACSPLVTCGVCAEVCPQQAITVETGRLTLDVTRCDACGLCEAACPNGAITLSGPAGEGWLLATCYSHAQKYDSVAIACSKSGDRHPGRTAVEVTCLGRLAWEVIVGLALSGWQVRYAAGRCQACSLRRGGDQWLANRQRAELAVAALGRLGSAFSFRGADERCVPAAPLVLEDETIGRRALLTEAAKFLATTLTGLEVRSVTAAARTPTWRRRWLVRRLRGLAGRPDNSRRELCLPWPALSLAGPCFLCGACATLCPVGALKVEGGILRHFPCFCTQCGLCQAVCPHKSLVLSGQTPPEDFLATEGLVLAVASYRTCSYCYEVFFATGQPDMCGRCSLQQRLGVLPQRCSLD